jgi:histone-lysine N-methyltransferase SETD1
MAHPVELKDVPNWREESIIKMLRRVQTRRIEGRITSENGCARCDGVRIEQEAKIAMRAEAVRWGRNKRKGEADTMPRVAPSRIPLSTGLGSAKNCESMEKRQTEANDPEELEDCIGEVGVSVQGSRIHGWGLFADQPFKAGDIVAEYVGEYVTHAMADSREKMYQEQRIQDYQFRADELVIDATMKGGHGRYINHNCSPNCIAKIVEGKAPNRHLKRVIIIAQRNIKAREEITYDYQFPLELDLDSRIPCNCGSESCRGFMNWDLPEKGAKKRVARGTKRGGNMRDRIRRLNRPRKRGDNS